MENLEYIDSHFKGTLSEAEAARFEEMVLTDPSFAEDVAFYLSTIQVAKIQSAEDRKKRFRQIYQQQQTTRPAGTLKKLWPYLAAAAVAGIIFGLFIFTRPASPQQLSDQYIQQHFTALPVTMSSRQDSMQTALSLYNQGNYVQALTGFEQIAQSDTINADAGKYAGIVCLRLGEFDKAINWFQRLERNTGLFANYGKFYHALVLIKRNQNDDNVLAKNLLQQVVDQGLEGKEDAAKWLKNWSR